jgi:AcrR family transcriptional regulator
MSAPSRRSADAPKAAVRLKRGERRRQLVTCARKLLETVGYGEMTWEQVARDAGVSPSVLGRHFADKLALLQGVVDEVRAETLAKWETETAVIPDPLGRLHALADAYLTATKEHARTFQAMHRLLAGGADDEALAVLRAYYLDAENLLAGVIAEGQQSGVFRRSLDPRVGAWQFIRTGLGYTLTQPLAVPLDTEPDAFTRAVDCLLHCLLKTDV